MKFIVQRLINHPQTLSSQRIFNFSGRQLSLALVSLGIGLTASFGIANLVRAATITDLPISNAPEGETRLNLNHNPHGGVKVSWDTIANASDVEFCLELSNDVSWWKGIKIFDQKHQFKGFLTRSNAAKKLQCETFTQAELGNGTHQPKVEFWKAMMFGVHTHIDSLDFTLNQVKGKRVTFSWLKD